MKLYIKQKVFSIGAKFSVKDEAGNDRGGNFNSRQETSYI